MTCQWAGCSALAFREDADGYLHCRPHWREHLAFEAESGRPCEKCGELFTSRTAQRKHCDDCRESRRQVRRQPMQPCGTRAAYMRHKNVGETPCEPCHEAERAYQQDRYRRRAA